MRSHSLLVTVLACLSVGLVLLGGEARPALAGSGPAEGLAAQAARAYARARYGEAVRLLRRALAQAPGSQELWERYDRAVVAARLDGVLSSIPKGRYKLMPWEFEKELAGGKEFFILDVREPEEFDKGHLKGAINVPFRQVMKHLDLLPRDRTILLICRTQHRSNYVMEALRAVGFTNLLNMAGGYRGWLRWQQMKAHGKRPPANGGEMMQKPPPTQDQGGGNATDDDDEEDFGC